MDTKKEYIKYKKRYFKLKNRINNQYGGEIKNAAVLLILNKKYVLLLKHTYGKVKKLWGTPGGMIDRYEDPETAALRELEEETGIIKNNNDIVISYTNTELENRYKTKYFIIKIDNIPDITLSSEHSDYDWFSLTDLINKKNRIKGFDITIERNDLIRYFSNSFKIIVAYDILTRVIEDSEDSEIVRR